MDILIFQISRTIANETPSTYGNLSCPCARQLTHKALLSFQDMSTKINRGNVMKCTYAKGSFNASSGLFLEKPA